MFFNILSMIVMSSFGELLRFFKDCNMMIDK